MAGEAGLVRKARGDGAGDEATLPFFQGKTPLIFFDPPSGPAVTRSLRPNGRHGARAEVEPDATSSDVGPLLGWDSSI